MYPSGDKFVKFLLCPHCHVNQLGKMKHTHKNQLLKNICLYFSIIKLGIVKQSGNSVIKTNIISLNLVFV